MRASPLPKSPSHLLHVLPIMRRFLCHLAGASRPWHTGSVTADCSHARLPETHVVTSRGTDYCAPGSFFFRLFLSRKLSPFISSMWTWWVSRSSRAPVNRSEPRISVHSAKGRLLVTNVEVRS